MLFEQPAAIVFHHRVVGAHGLGNRMIVNGLQQLRQFFLVIERHRQPWAQRFLEGRSSTQTGAAPGGNLPEPRHRRHKPQALAHPIRFPIEIQIRMGTTAVRHGSFRVVIGRVSIGHSLIGRREGRFFL